GLSRLAGSTAPSAAPAPTSVWSSSMKQMIWPSDSTISLRTAFRRSSNSPRYFEPATSEPMSSATNVLPFNPSGTSPATMRWASPSTMAVLPTPGSPMSTGLFLVRRESTWITRRISSSRPMTGESLPRAVAEILAAAALHRGQLAERRLELTLDRLGTRPELGQHRPHDAFTLFEERREQMLGLDGLMIVLVGLRLRRLQCFLRLHG